MIPMAGKVPPNDLDAERAVIAASVFDCRACDVALDALTPVQFYAPAHQAIWRALGRVRATGMAPDIVSLANALRGAGQLAAIGGAQYLIELADGTPAIANVLDHCKLVRSKYRQRELIAACHEIAAEGYGEVGNVDDWLDRADAKIHAVTSDKAVEDLTPTLRDTLISVFQDLSAENRDTGVTTGLRDLDDLLGPMLPGQMVVLGANSGVGKTSLATQIAMAAAGSKCLEGVKEVQQAVLIFSAEMSRHELATRILFGAAEVNAVKARRTNWLTQAEWTRLSEAANRVALRNVYFDDRAGLSPRKIRSKARAVDRQSRKDGFKLRLIVVDYLQLLDGSESSAEKREREISAISKSLRELGQELCVPVLVLAQLNEDARRDKRAPRKEDLRECKATGHDADKVILIHNTHADERRQTRRVGAQVADMLDHEIVDLIVDKNRGGAEGKVAVRFYPSLTSFSDCEPGDVETQQQVTSVARRRPIEHASW